VLGTRYEVPAHQTKSLTPCVSRSHKAQRCILYGSPIGSVVSAVGSVTKTVRRLCPTGMQQHLVSGQTTLLQGATSRSHIQLVLFHDCLTCAREYRQPLNMGTRLERLKVA
jgi:hypothetical protein